MNRPRMTDWGLATMDDGVFDFAPTRREAVLRTGFATPHTRRAIGSGCYEYRSAEGNTVLVGRIRDLAKHGIPLPEDCPEAPGLGHLSRSDGTCVRCGAAPSSSRPAVAPPPHQE